MHRLPDRALHSGNRQLIFERYWRHGYVGEALLLEISPHRHLQWVEFYSSALGVVRW